MDHTVLRLQEGTHAISLAVVIYALLLGGQPKKMPAAQSYILGETIDLSNITKDKTDFLHILSSYFTSLLFSCLANFLLSRDVYTSVYNDIYYTYNVMAVIQLSFILSWSYNFVILQFNTSILSIIQKVVIWDHQCFLWQNQVILEVKCE